MIKSFADRETQEIWQTGKSRRLPAALQRVALRKLWMLDKANTVEDEFHRETGWRR